MHSRSVLVHCPSCLGLETAVLNAEVRCRDGVFATWARERSHAIDQFDGVMSHSFKPSPLIRHDRRTKVTHAKAWVLPPAWIPQRTRHRGQQVSPRQIRISILQVRILVTVSQLTLHAGIAAFAFVLGVLFRRPLASILIPRFVHG